MICINNDSSIRGSRGLTKERPWWMMPAYPYTSLDGDDSSYKNSQELVDAQAEVFGYRYSKFRLFFYYLLNAVCFGIPFLIGRWYCQFKVFLKCVPVSLRVATVVLIKVSIRKL